MSAPVNISSVVQYIRSQHIPRYLKALDRDEEYIPYKAPTMQTPYTVMLVEANEASTWDNVRAAFWPWLTLAGFVVFPGTFTSLQNSKSLKDSQSGKLVQYTVKNVPLLPFAGVCCLFGIVETLRIGWKWRKNYVWLNSRICL
jgi:hypothetical protein